MGRALARGMHAWVLMAVGPWVGLGVAYGLSLRSLVRQGRGGLTRAVDEPTEIRVAASPVAASNG